MLPVHDVCRSPDSFPWYRSPPVVFLAVVLLLAAPTAAAQQTFTVDDTGDQTDWDPGDGVCRVCLNPNDDGTCADFGGCTLRAAIVESNASAGSSEITFDVTAVAPPDALPDMTSPVTVDGARGTSRVLLDGSAFEFSNPALEFRGNGNELRNIEIANWRGAGAWFRGADDNVVENVHIHDNGRSGLSPGLRFKDSNNNEILDSRIERNGFDPEDPSSSFGAGIEFENSSDNTIQGCQVLHNTGDGIQISDPSGGRGPSSNFTIGGSTSTPGTPPGNVLSGNARGVDFVDIEGTGQTVIQGNLIGTDPSGTAPLLNAFDNSAQGEGISIDAPLSVEEAILIGGSTLEARNIISGHGSSGVSIQRSAEIRGNYIGTDITGMNALPNDDGVGFSGEGVVVENNVISGNEGDGVNFGYGDPANSVVRDNIIGLGKDGDTPLGNGRVGIGIFFGGAIDNEITSNTISSNDVAGIWIFGNENSGPPKRQVITDNHIGTTTDGLERPNGGPGILIEGPSEDMQIGGESEGEGNTIMYNEGDGVLVAGGSGHRINRNQIFENDDLGINLDPDGDPDTPDGPTDNDAGDPDDGPNGLQNRPMVTFLEVEDGQTHVSGVLKSAPGQTYRLEFFEVSEIDSTGFGEGETFLEATEVTTDEEGRAPFLVTLSGAHRRVTATATDPDGNTSEFSKQPLIVNTSGDRADTAPTDPACDTGRSVGDEPECTLRAALQTANRITGPDYVAFDIPTDDPGYESSFDTWRIQPTSALPSVTDPVSLDGAPGTPPVVGASSAKSKAFACPTYIVDGQEVQDADGLVLRKGGSKIADVAFVDFPKSGIRIESDNNTIAGTCLGTAHGRQRDGAQETGVLIDGGTNNRIGGSELDDRNLISGHTSSGITIQGSEAQANLVYGNWIGTDATALDPLGNEGPGILVDDAPNNFVGHAHDGEPGTGKGNLIRASGGAGVLLRGTDATNNRIYGNWIGSGRGEQRTGLSNQEGGVRLEDGASDNWIGDLNEQFSNVIYDGVVIEGDESTGNRVHGNELAVPTDLMAGPDLRLPIDRENDGPSCFAWDDDATGNPKLPAPRILELTTERIRGVTKPNAWVEAFRVVDSGTQQGRYFPRQVEYVERGKAASDGTFEIAVSLGDGTEVTVVAIDEAGNTSEPAQLKRPIIAVPGIGGSWLEAQNGDNLWIPTALTDGETNDRLARMAMTPSGTSNKPVEEDGVIELVPPVVGTNVYSEWLSALQEAGYAGDSDIWTTARGTPVPENPLDIDLWRFPNDFRLNQLDPAKELKERIDWLTGEDPDVTRSCQVDLVSHSNGGVITSTYVRAFPEPSRNRVHRVVEIAAPYLGSLKGTQAHTMGYIFELEESLPAFDPEWGRMIEMTRNVPATYSLMPSRAYWAASNQFPEQPLLEDLDGKPLDSYDAVFDFMVKPKNERGLGRNEAMWNSVEASVHARIDDWRGWERPPHIFRIAGADAQSDERASDERALLLHSTPIGWYVGPFTSDDIRPGELRAEPGDSREHKEFRSKQTVIPGPGDGTVPLASATLGRHSQVGNTDLSGVKKQDDTDNPWIEDVETFPCKHLELVANSCQNENDRKLLDRMVEIFERGYLARPKPPATPGSMQRALQAATATQDLLYISSSAPLGVHVEDQEGRHTGPTHSDSLLNYEYEVPALGYWPNDLATVLSLPPTGSFTVTVHAATAAADVGVVRVIAADNDGRHVLFPTQSLATEGRLQIDLQGGGTTPEEAPLDVDFDGDGNYENTLTPAVTLTAASVTPARPAPQPFRIYAVAFQTETEDRTVDVVLPDEGGPAWDWEADAPADWITLEAVSGETPTTLSVRLASTDLPVGTHTDTLTITTRLEDYETSYLVPVTLEVYETATLDRLEVSPEFVRLQPGESQSFSAEGFDPAGRPFSVTPVWSATGGTIDSTGLYTAGEQAGTFAVTATNASGSVADTAVVEISGPPIPVELTALGGVADGNDVVLTWRTASETNNAGFEVQHRSQASTGGSTLPWEILTFVEGAGTTSEPQTYQHRVTGLASGMHLFRLKQIDVNGSATLSEEIEVALGVPDRFALHGAYPNPAAGTATIPFDVPRRAEVRLAIYDVLGRRVATLVDAERAPGEHVARVNASRLAGGVYFYRIRMGDFRATKKLVVVR